jgi:hypothetical protein
VCVCVCVCVCVGCILALPLPVSLIPSLPLLCEHFTCLFRRGSPISHCLPAPQKVNSLPTRTPIQVHRPLLQYIQYDTVHLSLTAAQPVIITGVHLSCMWTIPRPVSGEVRHSQTFSAVPTSIHWYSTPPPSWKRLGLPLDSRRYFPIRLWFRGFLCLSPSLPLYDEEGLVVHQQ